MSGIFPLRFGQKINQLYKMAINQIICFWACCAVLCRTVVKLGNIVATKKTTTYHRGHLYIHSHPQIVTSDYGLSVIVMPQD